MDLLETVRHLRDIGVSVRFERENIDTSGMDGELLLTLLAGFAEAEAESASEARLWSIRTGYEKGISCHGHPPYGYRWDGPVLAIFPEEAEAVKERLKGIVLEFQIKTGNNGRSFGTVSTKQVAEKLQREHGIQIDRRKIRGHESISTLGDTELNVDLYKNKVIGTIRVHVSAKSAK